MELKNKNLFPCPDCNVVPEIDVFQGTFKVIHNCKVSRKKFIGWDKTNSMDALNEWNNHVLQERKKDEEKKDEAN